MPKKKTEPYIKQSEALDRITAKYPHVGKEALKEAIRSGKISHQRSGLRPKARISIRMSDIETYLTKLQVSAPTSS